MKRILFAVVIVMTLSAALLAQGGRGGFRGRGGSLAGLKNALNLTDGQVTAINAVIQTEQSRMQAIRTEINQKRQTHEALLSAASPDPAAVGNAAISLRASEAKIKTENDYLISQVKQQLTGDQQQKLDTLIAAGRGLPIPGFGGRRGGSGGPLSPSSQAGGQSRQ
jgi:Spy/CpxP family protein refolding chaperone